MKKKGLIISTIVMVIVLVASLTTATYAWFSSTGQAEISDITVQTVASDGLQVAVSNGSSTWMSGTLTGYSDGKFSGGIDGFSSVVDFSALGYQSADQKGALGAMENAVTEYKTGYSAYETGIVTAENWTEKQASAYELFDDGTFNITDDQSFNSDTTYYTEMGTQPSNGTLVKPIGYSNGQPLTVGENIAVTVAAGNDDYLLLPIAVMSTTDVAHIFCTITLTAQPGAMSSVLMPGMAAASRIILQAQNGAGEDVSGKTVSYTGANNVEETTSLYKAPFASASLSNGVMTQGDGYNGTWTQNIVIASGVEGNLIKAGEIYLTEFTIWIEGEDGECIQLTAGSGFDVQITYGYSKALITESNGTITYEENTYTINAFTQTKTAQA